MLSLVAAIVCQVSNWEPVTQIKYVSLHTDMLSDYQVMTVHSEEPNFVGHNWEPGYIQHYYPIFFSDITL